MGAEINANINGTGTDGILPLDSSNEATSIPPSGTSSTYNQSTISKSDELLVEEMIALMMVAGNPLLMPPKELNVSDSDASSSLAIQYVTQKTEQQKSEIIRGVLDSWLENLEQIAKDVKEENIKHDTEDVSKRGPKSSTEYFAYLMQATNSEKVKELETANPLAIQFSSTYNQWMASPSPSSGDAGQYPDSSFVAGCLVCTPEAFRSSIGADSAMLGIQLSVSPVADALTGAGSVSGLPVDAQAAAAMVAAMLYNGALYKANVVTLTEAAQKGVPPQNLEFAMNYAKQVMAIVTANVGDSQSTSKNSPERNNLIRLMLTSMALNLLYRQAYGGMTGVEMEKLINGADISDIPDPAVRAQISQLVTMIQGYLPKETGARNAAIASLCEYVDDKESADSMLETTNLFAGMLNVKGINASRLGSAVA